MRRTKRPDLRRQRDSKSYCVDNTLARPDLNANDGEDWSLPQSVYDDAVRRSLEIGAAIFKRLCSVCCITNVAADERSLKELGFIAY